MAELRGDPIPMDEDDQNDTMDLQVGHGNDWEDEDEQPLPSQEENDLATAILTFNSK